MRKLGNRLALLVGAAALALALVPLGTAGRAIRLEGTATPLVTVKAGAPSLFAFKLSTTSVAKPGKVIFVVTNVGKLPHDFKINGKKTPLIAPGKSAKLVVSFKKKGSYPYLCTVPGHAAAGMKGVFTVK